MHNVGDVEQIHCSGRNICNSAWSSLLSNLVLNTPFLIDRVVLPLGVKVMTLLPSVALPSVHPFGEDLLNSGLDTTENPSVGITTRKWDDLVRSLVGEINGLDDLASGSITPHLDPLGQGLSRSWNL
ncbi:hypothetical protein BASA61_004862 [Batrachochytrium salamandrivorans]|nr:hypothetical protein BASA61_004862 [Batrachochytrium salamandrivorans]